MCIKGWAPATFKSSRGERAKGGTSVARPEDFMDEEDLEVLILLLTIVDMVLIAIRKGLASGRASQGDCSL